MENSAAAGLRPPAACTRSASKASSKIHSDDEKNNTHRAPQHDQRPSQLAGDEFFEAGDVRRVSFPPFFMISSELREQDVRFGLRLSDRHSWLQAAHHGQSVSPVAQFIHDGRDVEIYLQAR